MVTVKNFKVVITMVLDYFSSAKRAKKQQEEVVTYKSAVL